VLTETLYFVELMSDVFSGGLAYEVTLHWAGLVSRWVINCRYTSTILVFLCDGTARVIKVCHTLIDYKSLV